MGGDASLTAKKILVLGATGTIGPHVVNGLRARGAEVAVLTRDACRARGILPGDVEMVEGDPRDDALLLHAAADAASIFLLSAHSRDMADLQLRVIRTLRGTDLRIVKLSATSSAIRPDGPYACRQHWEIEQILTGSGARWSIVRPNSFMQTFVDPLLSPSARAAGVIADPLAGAGVSVIDGHDVGDVCAEVLVDPGWESQTLELTGARAISIPEIAALIGKETGTCVAVKETTPAEQRQVLLGLGLGEAETHHIQEMQELFRAGESAFVGADVERVLGRPPVAAEAYVHDRIAALDAATASDPVIAREAKSGRPGL